ncbi:ribose ABC transporter permease [Kaistia sp. 32K]|uniref:ABC transporter permease n=1 Tax=Kaistia sp. 32K TaxID=2795690 RepID=UPI0019155DAD|nr:ABC transporter permease [Kaistia sp. 32K]BCP53988.1 ribose ABC transporter permease [Kaistia sp. 32K]
MNTAVHTRGQTQKPAFALSINRLLKMDWLGAGCGVVLVVALLSFASPYFLTSDNLLTILVQTAVVAILAGGQTFVILTGQIDLATASVTALAGAVVGMLMVSTGLDPYLAIGLAISIGGAVGLFNGFLVAVFRLPAFIVTLAGLSLWRGLGLQLTGGFDSSPMPDAIAFLGRGEIGFVPVPVIIMLAYFVIMAFVLKHTKLGRYIYAIGSNEDAARLAGIRVTPYKMAAFFIGGLSSGLAAIVLIGRLDSSGGTIAQGLELDAIAAVVLGGTSLFGGRGSIWGALLGAVLMATIRNGMDLLQISPFIQLMTLGIVILVAVGLDVLRVRRFSRS